MRPSESFVGQPIRSLQTMLRVLAEYNGITSVIVPDGIYGAETRNTVIEFQKNNGLPATGIVDQQTWDAIVDQYEEAIIYIGKAEPLEVVIDPNKVYFLGDSSPNILIAQAILYYLSGIHQMISEPSREGNLDSLTAESLKSFQQLNNLPRSGNLDRKTWKQLSKQFTLNAVDGENNRNFFEKMTIKG